MSNFLFIDTETTGLPINSSAPPTDLQSWNCRLVSMAYYILPCDDDLLYNKAILDKGYYIIKPDGFIIPSSAAKIHGITTEIAIKEGTKIEDVLDHLLSIINEYKPIILVGHNIDFDINVIDSEFFRYLKTCPLNLCRRFCTLKSSVNYCNLPNNKYPKLSELYYSLFGENFNDQHNALADVEATYKCFITLKQCNIPILEPSKPRLFSSCIKDFSKTVNVNFFISFISRNENFLNQTFANIFWLLNLFCNEKYKPSLSYDYLGKTDLHVDFAITNITCSVNSFKKNIICILENYPKFQYPDLLPPLELPQCSEFSFEGFKNLDKIVYLMILSRITLKNEYLKSSFYDNSRVQNLLRRLSLMYNSRYKKELESIEFTVIPVSQVNQVFQTPPQGDESQDLGTVGCTILSILLTMFIVWLVTLFIGS